MSTGQIIKFGDTFANYNTAHFASHTFKVGFIKSAANGGIDPAVSTPAPCWGSGGTTNLSSSQVATGGTSYTGPQTLAGVAFSSVAGVATFSANNLTLAADASGFTNARWAIIYDDTDSTKRAPKFRMKNPLWTAGTHARRGFQGFRRSGARCFVVARRDFV